ncbi:MAG: Y-family DNA polymerase [Bacteroidales bacterium]|nr:MAG: Y-family DNA polymerase [Bacteroidales bacterium]
MFALVDGNNFYVSCERVFNPTLDEKPVVVLSNNDGCIISRSNEAKALGFKMGEPVFKRKELIEQNNVNVFSSNYTLYGDMSNRMMKTLKEFSPEVEVYSIDEAFLDLTGIQGNLEEYGQTIRATVYKNLGLPVGIGIANTKTLAKIANKIAKKQNGVFVIDSERIRDWALRNTPIEDVWGIGRQYAKMLTNMGVHTAYDFTRLDSNWVKDRMTVVGQRTREELLGLSCISLETIVKSKKNIATTRAFGKKLSDINTIAEAVATHAVRCAEKLRKQQSVANFVTVFIHTDPFNPNEKYIYRSVTVTMDEASNSNPDLAKAALAGLRKIYIPNILYKKTGVIVSEISSEKNIQGNLFKTTDREKLNKISKVTDSLNAKYGRDKLKLAVQGNKKEWKLKQEKLSPCFTTRWEDILKVKA